MADVVLNHKAAADHLEAFQVIEVDPDDRTVELRRTLSLSMAGLALPLMDVKIPIMTSTGTGTTSPGTDYDAKTPQVWDLSDSRGQQGLGK